ncbi:MAG: cyclic nucleotide-binding domain-containing protein [Chloroflexota bacterium]|nr:MAG: cyclic nucleotide-binding domain-containing protein [Chloroflexota bacterium]
MAPEGDKTIRALNLIDVFSDLDEVQLAKIASRFKTIRLEPWQPLFTHREPEDDFYIVQSGSVFVSDDSEEEEPERINPGEYFIEEALLYGRSEGAYITTDVTTELFLLEEVEFYQLVSEFPQVKPWLARNPESQYLVKNRDFSWLGKDEIIAFVARKHEMIFVFSLIGPIIFFLAALGIISIVSVADVSSTIWTTGAACSILLAVAAILWGIWNWIDWGNDYYIVTDQRVVWVEKVVWLYESRDEAPLTTILAINTTTTFLGRWLHYGSVIVKTFTGEITFRNLKNPQNMVAFIREYRDRVQKGSERREKRKIDLEVRQRLGWEEGEGAGGLAEGASPGEDSQKDKENLWQKYFKNIFTMRFEEGDVITYRKYWPTLFGKIWLPTLLIFLVIIVMGFIVNFFMIGQTSAQVAEILLGACAALILFVLIPWWIYRYIDWRNDIYQVTDKSIFDIERRPLGTEVRKAAPLSNILSLEHERVGFLGYMLNYGFVTINVGETQFVFRNVHDPAQVQQDIFKRLNALRREKEKADATKQRQRFVDVIEVYHRSAEEQEEDEYYDDFDDDFEVELGPDGYP